MRFFILKGKEKSCSSI